MAESDYKFLITFFKNEQDYREKNEQKLITRFNFLENYTVLKNCIILGDLDFCFSQINTLKKMPLLVRLGGNIETFENSLKGLESALRKVKKELEPDEDLTVDNTKRKRENPDNEFNDKKKPCTDEKKVEKKQKNGEEVEEKQKDQGEVEDKHVITDNEENILHC